jgi:hypothetical protein
MKKIVQTVKNCYKSEDWILNVIICCYDQEVMAEFKGDISRLIKRHIINNGKSVTDTENGKWS